MPAETKVTLAGREYTLRALPMRQAKAFREQFSGPVNQLISALEGAPRLEVGDMQAIGALLGVVKDVLLSSIDIALDMLFAYSPEMAADRERIESEAYDDEALVAVVEVVKLLYPFGSLKNILPGR